MTETLRLCQTSDVKEGEPVAANIEGMPGLAVYRIGDEYFVTDNLCTHGNALLTDGYQDGATIECPFHGGAFDIRSGEATLFPCQDPLRSYPVTVADGWITIERPA